MPNPISFLMNRIKQFLRALFGEFSWQGPPWYQHLNRQREAHAGLFCLATVCVLILAGVLFYGYHWYQRLPKPELVTAHITSPQITANVKDAMPDSLTMDFGIQRKNSFDTTSVAPLSMIGKEVEKGISINPTIKGEWLWQSDNRLVFIPKEDWSADQTYKIHFEKNIFATTAKMSDLNYSFSTEPFKAVINEFKFYQDPTNPTLRQAVATLQFNYAVDSESLEKHIALFEQNGKAFKFTLNYDERKREAYLHSETLPITDVERFLQLTLNKGIKTTQGSAETATAVEKKILIPNATNYLKVEKAKASIIRNEKDRPEQVLTVETTLGVTDADLNKKIHVYLLPKDYPASATEEAQANYAWKNPGEVTPTILALATPVDLKSIPSDRDYATLHSYKLNADSSRYIFVKVDKGLPGFGNFYLNQDFSTVTKVPEYPKEISFLHKGALLALSSEKKISVIVRGLPGVKFQIARVIPSDVNQLITQTRGNFNNPRFINPQFNQENISEIFSETQPFDAADFSKDQYTALDLGKYLSSKLNTGGPQGLFLLQAIGWDEKQQQPLDVKSSRLVLVTDLGIVAKDNSDGSHDIFVQSITQGKPVANVVVTILGKNGLAVLTQNTDASGHAHFPTLKDFIEDREPTVYLAQSGNDVAFMPFNNSDRQLNYSKYDIGGVYNNSEEIQTLSAYIFSDRGIYRPGDTAHIAMIVKQAYAQPQPPGLPLEVTVTDPRGNTVLDHKFTLDPTGYSSLDLPTTNSSPTGQYSINLFIVKDNHPSNLLGSATLRVAEFLPDTMRINAHLSTENTEGWVSPSNLTANVSLWNLYGAPAADRKISAKVLLTPQAVKFSKYPDYIFNDPLLDPKKPPKVFTDTLSDVKTNDQGQAQFDLNLARFEKATYQLTFFAEGFEAEGGRSVSTQTHTLVSPLDYLVGYKADADLNYLKQNSQHQVSFISVNPQLKQEATADLKMQLQALHPVTTLVKKPDGTFQYQSLIQTKIIETKPFDISAEGFMYTLPTQQIGDFAIVVLDKNNVELSHLQFSVVGDSQQPLPKNAELSLKLDKNEFMPDSDIEMQITAPYTGSGLITIERDKVYAVQWFQTSTTSSVQKIHIPKDFQGNGYINVAFVRDWNSPEIFVSPLSFAIAPFVVNHAAHDLKIDLTVPTLVKPGDQLTIDYKTDRPSKIIVFAVDEGILQAAAYQTPNPLDYFFQKRALEVTTQQILDQILPKYVQERELSAVGGDGGEAAALKTLNPFKRKTDLPVVFWSGIIDADATSKQLTYKVPDYFNGSIRVMAIAVAADAVGSASKSTEVRGNFVINPNVPTFVSPGDEFEVTASVANNVEKSGNDAAVNIELIVSPEIEVIGDNKQVLKITEGKEQTARFKLRAKNILGSATLSWRAENHSKTSQIDSTLSVRPASAYETSITSGYQSKGNISLDLTRVMYPEYRTMEAMISPNPLILISGLDRYLENYPFGCTEQLTSKAMPLLALAKQPWFSKDSQAVTHKINTAIQTIAQRQMADGGFSYWPGVDSHEGNKFASVYALHFLTDAREQGYDVPIDMLRNGMSYLKELASQEVANLEEARLQAYAIYILTRNEIVTTNYLTNLQLYLDKDKTAAWHNDITSVYIAATYQLLKSSNEANKLMSYYKPQQGVVGSESDFYNKNIADAEYLYLIARHFPDRLSSLTDSVVIPLVANLNSQEINTVLSGYTSLALAAYAKAKPSPASDGYSIAAKINKDGEKTLESVDSLYQKVTLDDAMSKVIFKSSNNTGFFYQLLQAGFDKNPSASSIKNGLEVTREYRDAQGNVVSNADLGAELEVHIQIRSLNNGFINNVAIIDLLPGGFDPLRDSIKLDNIDYADVREDRVVFFASVGPEAKEIVYRIKATNVGQFTIPSILANSMYDPNIKARSMSGKMEVQAR